MKTLTVKFTLKEDKDLNEVEAFNLIMNKPDEVLEEIQIVVHQFNKPHTVTLIPFKEP